MTEGCLRIWLSKGSVDRVGERIGSRNEHFHDFLFTDVYRRAHDKKNEG